MTCELDATCDDMPRPGRPVPAACTSTGAVLPARGATAQSVEQFYKGRTINFLVASVPGGVNDLTARLISRHLGKHIPGNPTIVVQNLQSSGLALANRIYDTPRRTALLIAIVERGVPQLAIHGRSQRALRPAQDHLARQRLVLRQRRLYASRSMRASTPRPSTICASRPSSSGARSASTGAGATNGIFTTSRRTCSGSTSRTCAAIAAPPTCSWRSSAASSTARWSGSRRSRSGSRRCGRPARSCAR